MDVIEVLIPIIENWSFQKEDRHFALPDFIDRHVHGKVSGDTKVKEGKRPFDNGDNILTSRVIEFLPENHPLTVRTAYTPYRLGAINPEFDMWMKLEGYSLFDYRRKDEPHFHRP
jgi:hypothetical protein